MRWFAKVPLLSVLALALVAAATAAESYQLALKFRPGQVIRFAIDQTAQMNLQIPGQTTKKIRLVYKAVLREQVGSVAPDGAAELLCQYESWQAAGWVDETVIPLDQAQADTMLNIKIRLRISPQGRVETIDPQVLPDGIDLDTLANFSFLRSVPLTVGQTWSTSDTRKVEGFLCQTTINNRLDRVDLVNGVGMAQISQDLRLDIPESPVNLTETLNGQVSASGSILGVSSLSFNLNTGLVEKQISIVNGKLLAKVRTGEARLEMPLVIDVTSIIALLV